jgi:hypothetical protein
MASPIPEPDQYDKAIARTIATILRKQPAAPLAAADLPLIAAWYFRNGANLDVWPTEADLVAGLNRMLADQIGRPIEGIRWTVELNEDDPKTRLPLPDLAGVPDQIIDGLRWVAVVLVFVLFIAALAFLGIKRLLPEGSSVVPGPVGRIV